MKILFVYSVQKSIIQEKPLLGQEGIYHGISYIAGMLKRHGHECSLVVLDRRYKKKNIQLLSKHIQTFAPELISFTAVFSEFAFICDIAGQIKELFPNLFLYAGGVHITLNPDEKYLSIFDAICIGEGEYPTLELVTNLEKKQPVNNIQNLWIKTPDGIKKNTTRPFISDLDELASPERNMWQDWILEPNTRSTVLIGRGCPFNCTYCSNHKLRKVSSGRYVRMRSPENIISEIKELYLQFPDSSEIYLEVETLATDLDWLEDFCTCLHLFGKETEFRIKFGTNLRIFPRLDVKRVFELFRMANITSVTIGLESGSYRIRKEILNRDYSNEIIREAVNAAKEQNIEIALYNMVGLPTETPEEFKETLLMNQQIQPSFHATSIFFPYQGTALYDMCEKMNLLPQKINTKDERQTAVLDLPGFSKKQIQKSFDSFHYNVYKKGNNKSIIKTFIYYSMCYLGHNFYANQKIRFIRLLYLTKNRKLINPKLFSIFQKGK